jgi:hypothetical protein
MRKFPLALLIALAFSACKKDRTCACTVTRNGTSTTEGKVEQVLFGFPVTLADTTFSQPVYEVRVYDKKMEDVSKSSAKKNCISYSEPYSEKTLTSVPATSFNVVFAVTNTGTDEYDCKLK